MNADGSTDMVTRDGVGPPPAGLFRDCGLISALRGKLGGSPSMSRRENMVAREEVE